MPLFLDWLSSMEEDYRLMYRDANRFWKSLEREFVGNGEELLRQAAEEGHVQAMLWLALLIKKGKIAPPDAFQAWLRKAVASDHDVARLAMVGYDPQFALLHTVLKAAAEGTYEHIEQSQTLPSAFVDSLVMELFPELELFHERLVQTVNRIKDLAKESSMEYTLDFKPIDVDYLVVKLLCTKDTDKQVFHREYIECFMNNKMDRFKDRDEKITFEIWFMRENLRSPEEREEELQWIRYGKKYPNTRVGERKKQWDGAVGKLEQMIGLEELKKEVSIWEKRIAGQRRLMVNGKQPVHDPFKHLLLIGNSGTGKSSSVPFIHEVLQVLEVVGINTLVRGNREDFVDLYTDGTATKTKEFVKKAIGGVLLIDDAHLLFEEATQAARMAVTTLIHEMEKHATDLFVILAGHPKGMNRALHDNSQLRSMSKAIRFPDYTKDEQLQIFKLKAAQGKLQINEEVEQKLQRLFERRQIVGRKNNGNGHLVQTLFEEATQKRLSRLGEVDDTTELETSTLLADDLPDVEADDAFDFEAELAKLVGNESIKQHIRLLNKQLEAQKRKEKIGIPTGAQSLHMVFTGNPGTGKTTVARLVGNLLQKMGLLKVGQVVEARREDFVAEFLGQTEAKTKKKIEEALGGVLFIDEAYALVNEVRGDYGRDVINMLVADMENHRENLLVILAGYDKEMEAFFRSNSGLRSRFPYTFQFEDYKADELYDIFLQMAEGYILADGCEQVVKSILRKEAGNKSGGNGRFVRTFFEKALLHQEARIVDLDLYDEMELKMFYPGDLKKAEG